jgi:uncharacterized protein (TIGR02246 family)
VIAVSDLNQRTLPLFHEALGRAVTERDAAAVVELYTEECTLILPDGAVLRGRKQLAEAFNQWVGAGFAEQYVEKVTDLLVGDSLAIEEGVSRGIFVTADGPVVKRNNYIITFVKGENGMWLMDKDIWTTIPELLSGTPSY